MKIKDGFKFGLGYFIAGGLIRYAELVIVDKDPKYTKLWKNIATKIKGTEIEEEALDEFKTCKNKIGFTID